MIKFVRSGAVLILGWGTYAPVSGQPGQDGAKQSRPSQQQARKPQGVKGVAGRPAALASQPAAPAKARPGAVVPPSEPQRSLQEAMAWQQHRGWARKDAWQGHQLWQQGRAERWESEHRSWAQRGGYGGSYIPQSRFRLAFGSQHPFRIESRPVMYLGYPRIAYGGFSFLLLDRWPEYWAENWYQDDDVYIEYEEGYYLLNRKYPRVRLAITVVQ